MENSDTTLRLEDLVRETRRLVLDSQSYFAQRTRTRTDSTLHEQRERRILEIKNELAKMMKAGGV
jgi:hypothetical protein